MIEQFVEKRSSRALFKAPSVAAASRLLFNSLLAARQDIGAAFRTVPDTGIAAVTYRREAASHVATATRRVRRG